MNTVPDKVKQLVSA
jgi:isocitrate lyase